MDAVVGRRRDQGQPICQAIFDVGSKFEFSIGWNRNEMPLRIERMGGIRKKRIGNDLPVAGRQQPGTPHAASMPAPVSPPAAAMSARRNRGIRNGKPFPAWRVDNYRHIKKDC